MKKLIIVITAIVASVWTSVSAFGQEFTLTSPTNNAVYYMNDMWLPIHWNGGDRTANSGMVKFFVKDTTHPEVYFGARPLDNGGVDWEISKLLDLGLSGTNFTLRAQSASSATVSFTLLPGSRPVVTNPPVDPGTTNNPPSTNTVSNLVEVKTEAKTAMAVSWKPISGHIYRVESAATINAQEWTTVVEGTVDPSQMDENGYFELDYLADKDNMFFRVRDVTDEN